MSDRVNVYRGSDQLIVCFLRYPDDQSEPPIGIDIDPASQVLITMVDAEENTTVTKQASFAFEKSDWANGVVSVNFIGSELDALKRGLTAFAEVAVTQPSETTITYRAHQYDVKQSRTVFP